MPSFDRLDLARSLRVAILASADLVAVSDPQDTRALIGQWVRAMDEVRAELVGALDLAARVDAGDPEAVDQVTRVYLQAVRAQGHPS